MGEERHTRKAPVCIGLQERAADKRNCSARNRQSRKESEVAEQEQRLSELAPAVKNMERLAADFSANPEQILPEAGALETGRSYREKKQNRCLHELSRCCGHYTLPTSS